MEDVLIGDKAAAYCGVTYSRLYELARMGRLGVKISGHYLFTRAELDAFRDGEKDKGGRPRKLVQPANETPAGPL